MPTIKEITPDEYNVAVINSISKKYPHLRQKSKAPTFLLTYAGTWRGLMENIGFSEQEAKTIEQRYHELYKISTEWVQSHIQEANKQDYVTAAFGLRVRTPLLGKVVMSDASSMPWEAQKEARTAGNALGQSWGLLNNRAGVELYRRLLLSPFRAKILPVAHIHDSQYFLVANDPDAVAWLNKNLTECMHWNDDPLIYHPEVGLGGELDIFFPTWADSININPTFNSEQLYQFIKSKGY